jgi:hypothetical protein
MLERLPHRAAAAPVRVAGQQHGERREFRQAQNFGLPQSAFKLRLLNLRGEVEERSRHRRHRYPLPEGALVGRESCAVTPQPAM